MLGIWQEALDSIQICKKESWKHLEGCKFCCLFGKTEVQTEDEDEDEDENDVVNDPKDPDFSPTLWEIMRISLILVCTQ